MDPHKRHLKKLKRLQDLRKQKLKEKEKVKKKKEPTEDDVSSDSVGKVENEMIEEQNDKIGNELI